MNGDGSHPVAAASRRPVYARVLRLRNIHPSGWWCFLFFEGMIALGVLLALTELVSWWAVLVLPAAVAVMVKLNDLLAGARAPAAPAAGTGSADAVAPVSAGGTIRQISRDPSDTLDPADSPRQRFRQSARRRYE